MKYGKQFWVTLGIFNLCIVALLGVMLRSKMVFPLEWLDFSNILEAHYHFAMNGWIISVLMVLMVYELLPGDVSSKPIYQRMRVSMVITSYGILGSFVTGGYTVFTMTFITAYVLLAVTFAWVFSKDIIKAKPPKPILILCISAMISLVLSCIGPETMLGYVLAAHSVNVLMFRDTAYTYLHFQYNGFFPLAIFALFFNFLYRVGITSKAKEYVWKVAIMWPVTIIPALFLSYLWHYPNVIVRSISAIGCVCLYIFLFFFFKLLWNVWAQLKLMTRYVKFLSVLSLISLTVKTILQTGTVFPFVGIIVFGNRPIIIGYIHLVMLGFVTLYLLSHFVRDGLLNAKSVFARASLLVFASAVVVNEVLLMLQGLGQIFMTYHPIYLWLLWGTMIWLLAGASMIFLSKINSRRPVNQA